MTEPVIPLNPTAVATLPRIPVLVGLYHVIPMGPDRVLVANAGRTIALSGTGLAERVGPLLDALDGTATRDQLEARFPELVPTVLAGLAAKGLVTDAAPAPDTTASAPQLAALALPGAASPAEVAWQLARATVAVAGCGPVGGQVAVLLAKAGVGRLVLADQAPVAGRDIAVSAVLAPAHEGRSRADTTAELCRIAGLDAVETRTAPDGGQDLTVIELGYDGYGASVADCCLAAGSRYLIHSQDALAASVGPLFSPGGDPCHHCLADRRLSHLARTDEHEAYRRRRAIASPGPDAYLAAHSAVVAGLVATEALAGVLDAGARTAGAILFLDLAGMDLRAELVHPVPGCAACRAARQPA